MSNCRDGEKRQQIDEVMDETSFNVSILNRANSSISNNNGAAGYTSPANGDCTLCLILSRMARTSSIGFPLGSGRGQSSRRSPGT
jgi:hypothetical protein